MGAFYGLAGLSIAISLPLWLFTNSAAASLALCACITAVSVWYVVHDARIHGGLTFSSCFVAVSAFVFVARGLYISVFNDFDLLTALGQPAEHRQITNALAYVLYGTLALIFGALLLERKAVEAQEKYRNQGKIALSLVPPDLSLVFIGLQIGFFLVLLPYGEAQARASLAGASDSAYVYLLPTLIHGFNLYIFSYLVSGWIRKRGVMSFLTLLSSIALMLSHAYCLYNMSNFRGFYLIGIFTAVIVFMLARLGKVPVLLLLLLFALYPLFKNIGSDRTLSNKEMVQNVLLNPHTSYNGEGMERAFGSDTDINMLDTLVASLNYEHKFHPYVWTYLYVFVHWIPRSVWPGKPPFGITADVSYTNGFPFTPGIIGFFNDDGGKIYMIIVMGFLGALFKWCEILVLRIRGMELYLCVWAALFLTSLVTVRYLPYQAFYGFLVFFVPTWLLNRVVKMATGQGGAAYQQRKRKGQEINAATGS